MELVEQTYELMRTAVERGANKLGSPQLVDNTYTTIGMLVVFGELVVCGASCWSFDPAFFIDYKRMYDERFEHEVPTAAATYELARDYVRWDELVMTLAETPSEDGPLACFCAGISPEAWADRFAEFTASADE